MKKFLHRIRHLLSLQPIVVESEWRLVCTSVGPAYFQVFVGARCVVCDETGGWHGTRTFSPLDQAPARYRIWCDDGFRL